ncbi:MAG: hypothetical protein WCB68_11055, partial [Pyrinomonadaceae bacterium]
CGFRLAFVSELIINEGLPAKIESIERSITRTERRRRYKQGAKLLFFSIVALPIAIGLSVIFDAPGPLIIPATMFLAGIFLMIYSRLFIEEGLPAREKSRLKDLKEKASRPALPPSQSIPIAEQNSRAINTAEIRQPPSVTENTTRLLDKDNL